MGDAVVLVKQDVDGDRPIDNVLVENEFDDLVYRQRIALAGIEDVLSLLTAILGAVDDLEISTDQISVDAGTINLATDQLETLLGAIRDRLPAAFGGDGGIKAHIQNLPATQPVSGTFWQATQPVSGPVTDAQLRAAAVSVTDARLPAALDADGGVKTHVQNFPVTQPVSGTVAVSNLPATQPVSGTVAVSNFPASTEIANDSGNPIPVRQYGSPTAATTRVGASTSPVTLLAMNTDRIQGVIYNEADEENILYVKFGLGASSTDYTLPIAGGGYFEFPVRYLGAITGVWVTAAGAAQVTEF